MLFYGTIKGKVNIQISSLLPTETLYDSKLVEQIEVMLPFAIKVWEIGTGRTMKKLGNCHERIQDDFIVP